MNTGTRREQLQNPTMMMTGQKQMTKAMTSTRAHYEEGKHPWRRRRDDPAPHPVDHACFLLTITPVPTSTLPTCVLWPHPSCATTTWKPLLHSDGKLLDVMNVVAIEGVTSEYRCWCLSDAGFRYSVNTLGVVASCECGICGWEYYQLHPRAYPYFICRQEILSGSWRWGLSSSMVIPQY